VTTWSPDFLDSYETAELALPGVEPARVSQMTSIWWLR
jgi:hypothetical protein